MFDESAWWAGVDVYRQNGGGGFDFVTTVEAPAVIGVLTSSFYGGPVGRWDRGNTLSVRFFSAAGLLSLSEAQVLGGAGALAVKDETTGQWEVVQYQNAALTGANSYNLTKLLRGQLGTEAAMQNPAPAGARVVVLDTNTLGVLSGSLDNRALAQTLRYEPSSGQVTDATFTEVTIQPQGVGLRPWSVAQIAGRRDPASGDVAVTWLRRTRFAGDSWDPDTVPLNEETESYDLSVVGPGFTALRVVYGLTAPAWTYPAAQQVTDFSALQANYTVAIAQRSALFGLGQTATKTVIL